MENTELFRNEVFETRKQRLYGEVVLSQPLSTEIMVGALIAIIVIAAIWITQGTYSRIETVPGILVTDQATSKVFAQQPGVVIELAVKDGAIVNKGDRIAVVKLDRQGESGRDILSQSALSIDERMQLGDQQISIANQRMALERQRLEGVIGTSVQQVASLDAQIDLQAQVVASNRQIFEQIAKVVERGFVSKVEFERRRQTLIASEQQLESLKQQRLTRQSEGAQATAQIAALPVEAARSSSDIRLQQSALEQQKTQIEGERSYVIAAPISGRVTAVQTAIGRMATAQTPLMVIVPEGATLHAELYAPTSAVGFVKMGQETRILFDAFPYQRFGSFTGRISSVSKTVFDPRETDVPIKLEQAVYKITVDLDRQYVTGYGDKIALQPGMTLNANIVLERQSFLDWILSPLNAVRKRAA
jgi:membrane fusion protein